MSTISHAYAAVLASTRAVVSKRRGRSSVPPAMPISRLQPNSIDDLPRLLPGTAEADRECRLLRATSIALEQSFHHHRPDAGARRHVVDRPSDGEPRSTTGADDDSSCPFCSAFYAVLYGDAKPRVKVVDHHRPIETDFNPANNTSRAAIEPFRLLCPMQSAERVLNLAIPLNWHQAAPHLFKKSEAAVRHSPQGPWKFPDDSRAWLEAARKGTDVFLHESVNWPWNEGVSAKIDNILRISDFSVECSKQRGRAKLAFDYSLESCLFSNLGIEFEPAGMDVDDGHYAATAVPLLDKDGNELDASHRDVMNLARQMREQWNSDVALLTIEASKRVRYTVSSSGPSDLWAMLTYMAPATLFLFMNRTVCQTIHFLEAVSSESLVALEQLDPKWTASN